MTQYSTRVYQNKVIANNTENFGAEGTPVASVPAGSGVVINSNDKKEGVKLIADWIAAMPGIC